MAGDWLKMRLDLQTHPKVVRILSATKSDKFRAIGGLHAVWSVFDTHSSDGRLAGYTAETLDHIIGWPGFSEAMISVGWLQDEDPDALTLPDFDEHNGKGGKRRAEDLKRKREERNPKSVRKVSANEPDENGTREEKRREEKSSVSRGTALPEDWHPSDEDTAFCKTERPDLIPSEVAKRFYDYWIAVPGIKGRKLNWSSTWRNWVRSQSPGKDVPPPKKEKDWL